MNKINSRYKDDDQDVNKELQSISGRVLASAGGIGTSGLGKQRDPAAAANDAGVGSSSRLDILSSLRSQIITTALQVNW